MMFCFLHKWRISTALDTGKALSPGARRHLETCPSCRGFARLSGVLDKQLTHDGREFLEALSRSGASQFREQRIVSAITSALETEPAAPARSRPLFRLRPAFAAALLAVIIAAAIIYSPGPFSPTANPEPGASFFTNIGEQLDLPQTPVRELAAQVESPLNREMDGLKNAARSTVEFFKSYLDTGI